MISMDDVAVKAKVSKATVSRVLNGKTVVSPQARENVISACQELNYRLNFNIQDLVLKSRTGSTRNIAFVMVGKEFADPGYARLIDGVSSAVNKFHYHLMLVKISGSECNIYELPPVLRDERVDGVLLTGELQANTIELMEKLGPKCVVIGNYSSRLLRSLSSVQLKLEARIFDLMERLVKLGKKRIAFAEECLDNYASAKVFNAYKQALKEFGLVFDEKICYFGHGPFSGLFDVMKPVFCKAKLPFDSVLCMDMRIAQEISHLLFGHFGLNKQINIVLATFRQFDYFKLPAPAIYSGDNFETMVKTALQQLIDQIEGKEISKTIFVN
jgi:LacI family transcriptional regulator